MTEKNRNYVRHLMPPHMGRKKDVDKISPEVLEKNLDEKTRELLTKIRQGRKDPVFFAEEILGIDLHDGQKYWIWISTHTQPEKAFQVGLDLFDKEFRPLIQNEQEFMELWNRSEKFLKNILVPSNRWGKTMVTSVKHIWYNFYKMGVQGTVDTISATRCGTLNLSPHSNQCQAGYDYILDILQSQMTWSVHNDDGTLTHHKNTCLIEDFFVGSNKQQRLISFKNGTYYRAVPTGEDQASSLAGMRFLYISYDECAQSLHLKEELPAKIMSRLIDFGGPLDLVSTPEVDKPSHQYFYHVAKLGLKHEEGWFTLVGRNSDNYFLATKESEAILEAIRSTDPAKYRQVKYGEFVTTGKKMFDNLTIERLWDADVPPPVMLGHSYLVSVDWGFADTGDPTVIYVIDYTEAIDERKPKYLRRYRVDYRESIRGGSPVAVLTRVKILQREWNDAAIIHDASSMGGVIIKKMLREMNIPKVYDYASDNKLDMLFVMLSAMSENRQAEMDAEGKVADLNPDFGRIRSYYIPQLEEQMGNYQYNPEKGVSDKRLEQDDVMALGMGIWYLDRKFLRTAPKQVEFNPLATTVAGVFGEKEARRLGIKNINIPERRIL